MAKRKFNKFKMNSPEPEKQDDQSISGTSETVLVPNEETRAAMESARIGDVENVGSIQNLFSEIEEEVKQAPPEANCDFSLDETVAVVQNVTSEELGGAVFNPGFMDDFQSKGRLHRGSSELDVRFLVEDTKQNLSQLTVCERLLALYPFCKNVINEGAFLRVFVKNELDIYSLPKNFEGKPIRICIQ